MPEVRRLQMTKSGSYLITLPKEWVKRHQLKEGDPLSLEVMDGALLVSAETMEPRKATIALERAVSLEREIRAKYLLGFEIIEITAEQRLSREHRERIKDTIHRLIGIEIVDEKANSVTLQCLLHPAALPAKSVLKREYSLAAGMHEEAVEALFTLDRELAEAVIRRDDEVDKLYFLLVRQLRTAVYNVAVARKLGVTPLECLDLRIAAKYIEAIADCAVKVAEGAISMGELCMTIPEELCSKIEELHEKARLIHEAAVEALLKGDVKRAEEIAGEAADLSSTLNSVNKEIAAQKPPLVAQLLSISANLYQIGELGLDIAELVATY